MRPRLSITRVSTKRLSRASKSTRAPKKIHRNDEYFLRSWVLDELNKAIRPITKDIYRVRKTLYEEKREIFNRVSLLEDDVRNITSIVNSDRFGRNPQRWMSRSSINPSNSSSADNIAETSEIQSPVMIDVQRLELHLQEKAAKSVEDLTILGDMINNTFTRASSQNFLKGVETRHNLKEVMSQANKRRWQYSQSMDAGLDLIPLERNDSSIMYTRKRRSHDIAGIATAYPENRHVKTVLSCRKTLIGSDQIDEEFKENEDPTKTSTKRRILTAVHDATFSRKCASGPMITDTQDTAVKVLNDDAIVEDESIFKKPMRKVGATRGKEVKRNILEAEREGKEDLNKLVLIIEGIHSKYLTTYTEICKLIKGKNGRSKFSVEELNEINSSQEQFLGLLEKSKSGSLTEDDTKLAQDLADDIEAIHAKIQAIDSIRAMKLKKNTESENFEESPQNEIQEDKKKRTKLCDEIKQTVTVKQTVNNEKNENHDSKEKQMNIIQENVNDNTETTIKKFPSRGLPEYDLKTLLGDKRSKSQTVYYEENENQDLIKKQMNNIQEILKDNAETSIKRFPGRGLPENDLRILLDNKRSKSQSEPLQKIELNVNRNSNVSIQSREKALQCKQDSALPQKIAPIGGFEGYQNLLENFQKVEEVLAEFSKDKSLKQIRVDCQRTINLTLNTISAQSAAHLSEKYEKLTTFLNNGTVMKSGKPVTASLHPLAALYSINYLAMKTVKQGELCVSQNPKSAYAIASVVVALWTDMPLYGKLLLFHFYEASPYLIPTYWEKEQAESEEQYNKRLGFAYPKNEKEDLDRFLMRQSGIMRLYCAIIVTPHNTSNTTKQHPLPISEAWKWLTKFITLTPKPDISATVLLDLLEVTGHMLASTYKSQFWKIINTINNSFLPKIEQVTPAGRRGPLSRLQAFLERVLARKTVPPPKGLLPPDFW